MLQKMLKSKNIYLLGIFLALYDDTYGWTGEWFQFVDEQSASWNSIFKLKVPYGVFL